MHGSAQGLFAPKVDEAAASAAEPEPLKGRYGSAWYAYAVGHADESTGGAAELHRYCSCSSFA